MCVLIWMHPWVIKVVQLWQGVAFDYLQDLNCQKNRLERWSWGNFAGGVLPSLHSERPWLCYKYVTILQVCGLVILKTFSGPSLMLNQDLIPKQAPCAGSQSTVYWCLLDSDTVILCLGTFCIWTERGSQGHTKDDSDFQGKISWALMVLTLSLAQRTTGLKLRKNTWSVHVKSCTERKRAVQSNVGERADPEDNFLEAVVSGSWWHS